MKGRRMTDEQIEELIEEIREDEHLGKAYDRFKAGEAEKDEVISEAAKARSLSVVRAIRIRREMKEFNGQTIHLDLPHGVIYNLLIAAVMGATEHRDESDELLGAIVFTINSLPERLGRLQLALCMTLIDNGKAEGVLRGLKVDMEEK